MSAPLACWCGNADLAEYSPDYRLCAACQTLVCAKTENQDLGTVRNDDQDYYGRNYWYAHQEKDLGLANIESRARTDLNERCQHWLATLLRYRLPPAKLLELGCAHGGFVALLRAAGFDATGLELSPTIVEFARTNFDVPMLTGPIEQQDLPAQSLDVIVMMDVLEHLPDPLATVRRCAELLKDTGVLLIQTPRFPEGMSFEQLTLERHPFVSMMLPHEHLNLFSQSAAIELLRRAGLASVAPERPMFPAYDMFLVASASSLAPRSAQELESDLLRTSSGRLTLARLDNYRQIRELQGRVAQIDADREERLRQILALTAQVNELRAKLAESENDRAQRLEQINTLTAGYNAVVENRDEVLKQLQLLAARLAPPQPAPAT